MAWQENYSRMKRLRSRLDVAWNEYTVRPEGLEHTRDEFYYFFQTCFHLVDWLENDRLQPIRRKAAKQFVHASTALDLCRRLCDGSKHATLETKGITAVRPEREVVGELPIMVRGKKVAAIQVTGDEMTVVARPEGSKNAFDLADECIGEWDRFLSGHGLTLPS